MSKSTIRERIEGEIQFVKNYVSGYDNEGFGL